MPRLRALSALTALAVTAALTGGPAGAGQRDCGPLPLLLPCLAPPVAAPQAPTATRTLLVRLAPAVPVSSAEAVLTQFGVRVVRVLPQIHVVSVRVPEPTADAVAAALRRSPSIDTVEPEETVALSETTPNDARWTTQWGLQLAGFTQAWDVSRGSVKTVVAVVDTGVERSHPDLLNAVLPGRDLVDGDADPSDPHGHGTAVAGVLAARTNNRAGVAGACWNCRVLPVRVIDRDGRGDTATLAAGILWAVDHGADVINLSVGGARTTVAERDAVAYAVAHDVVLVAAAGNDGTTRRQYPAALEAVIAVTATDSSDRLYSWSTRGPWVDVAAPGCNTAPRLGQAYATFCGTSSATPLVAGLAGLVRSADPRASAGEVRRIVRTAAALVGAEGTARLDAARALQVSRPQKPKVQRPRATLLRRLVASIRRARS
jgi:subtilisin family serine protease